MEKVSLKMVIINVESKTWESLKFDFPNKISFFSLYAIQLVFLAILQRRFLLAKCFRLLTVDSNCHSIFSLQQNACDKNWITFISYRLNLCGCLEKKLVCTNKKIAQKKSRLKNAWMNVSILDPKVWYCVYAAMYPTAIWYGILCGLLAMNAIRKTADHHHHQRHTC